MSFIRIEVIYYFESVPFGLGDGLFSSNKLPGPAGAGLFYREYIYNRRKLPGPAGAMLVLPAVLLKAGVEKSKKP